MAVAVGCRRQPPRGRSRSPAPLRRPAPPGSPRRRPGPRDPDRPVELADVVLSGASKGSVHVELAPPLPSPPGDHGRGAHGGAEQRQTQQPGATPAGPRRLPGALRAGPDRAAWSPYRPAYPPAPCVPDPSGPGPRPPTARRRPRLTPWTPYPGTPSGGCPTALRSPAPHSLAEPLRNLCRGLPQVTHARAELLPDELTTSLALPEPNSRPLNTPSTSLIWCFPPLSSPFETVRTTGIATCEDGRRDR